ncbi:MAG: TetR/AcrR family transcriptional regulator [Kineosporiaceae bacterium]
MTRTIREPLSRSRVLAAAVALADAEGVEALTMRRLAVALDVRAMSLYHYLPAKQALLDGVVETVLAETVLGDPVLGDPILGDPVLAENDGAPTGPGPEGTGTGSGDWRGVLRQRFLAARQVTLRHPWLPGLLSSRSNVPPVLFAYYDRIVGTLVDAGFSYHLAHRALHAFGSLPLGFVQEIFRPDPVGGTGPEDTAEADLAAMASALPHLTAMVAAEVHDATDPTLGWCDSQTEFEFTVDLLLNGLERLRTGSGE